MYISSCHSDRECPNVSVLLTVFNPVFLLTMFGYSRYDTIKYPLSCAHKQSHYTNAKQYIYTSNSIIPPKDNFVSLTSRLLVG